MSKDKYPSIFSPQTEAVVFIIFATHTDSKLGEGDLFRPIARAKIFYGLLCLYILPLSSLLLCRYVITVTETRPNSTSNPLSD